MKTIPIILLFLFPALGSKSQYQQIVGLDLGVTHGTYIEESKLDNYQPEINAHYSFVYKLFMVKTQIGIRPFTHFDVISKSFLTIGFSTPINKTISWHMCGGLGYLKSSKKTYDDYDDLNPTNAPYTYTFSNGGSRILSTGFYVKPRKESKMLMGLEAVWFEEYLNVGGKEPYRSAYPISYCLSFCYLFNKEKK